MYVLIFVLTGFKGFVIVIVQLNC